MSQNTFFGGSGNDVFFIENADDVVVEAPGGGTDSVYTSVSSYTLPANVEWLSYIGAGDFHGVGNASNNRIQGGTGNDTLEGLAGNDTLIGGAGNDVYIVEDVGDFILEASGGGTDTVLTSLASYSLSANLEMLRYTGIGAFGGVGNSLDNLIQGGAGNDTLSGGAGNDTLVGGAGADALIGGAGFDIAIYQDSSTGVTIDLSAGTASGGDAAGDQLSGIEGIVGSELNDLLIGDAWANSLQGMGGNDTLIGGAGDDTLIGGAGANRFEFTDGSGNDVIAGFGVGTGDVIVLKGNINGTGISNFSELKAAMSDNGGDAIINLGSGNSIRVTGMSTDVFSQNNFLFV